MEKALKGACIIGQSGGPTSVINASAYGVIRTALDNENITRANGWIQEIAAATGTRYADSCSVLKDANGALRAEYCNGDGIHLNADGFNAVLNYLRTHAYQ